jgi:hypothetical protein
MRIQFGLTTLVVVQWLVNAGVCAAQEGSAEKTVAPYRVLVEFEGGLPGTNLARVLTRLRENGIPIPSRPVEVRKDDTLCIMIIEAGFPPPCSPLATYIIKDKTFPGKPDGRLATGQVVNLPDIQPTPKTVIKSYARYEDTERKLDEKSRVWREHSAVKLPKHTETEVGFQHRIYSTTFSFASPEQAKQAALAIAALDLSNIALDVVISSKKPTLYSMAIGPIQVACQDKDSPIDPPTRSYLQMFDSDKAAVKVQEERDNQVTNRGPSQKTPIYLIDTKLLPLPNLYPAFGAKAGSIEKPCQWMFEKAAHHANHLAGIIASQGKGYGFEGIARHTVLRSYNMFPTSEEMQHADYRDMPDYIQENAHAIPVRIFLMAHGKPAEQYSDYLPSPHFRHHFDKLGKAITNRGYPRPIVMVAAGDSLPGGINIGPKTNLFPQVLGDAANVIVVTACVECKRDQATLLLEANHSAEERASKFVHVAAPGGTPIPGWTSQNSMGAASGTSQAAAFAAGIAARMLNSYPSVYQESGVLKFRLQACSWPLPHFVNGALNPDVRKLAAGVLDPAVCALDPYVAWVKEEGKGWSGVPMKRWIAPRAGGVFIKEGGERLGTPLGDVLRVMKTAKTGAATWTVYSRRAQSEDEFERGWGQINKEIAASIDKQAEIELCDGSRLPLSELTDVLLPAVVRECPEPTEANVGSSGQSRFPG